MSHYKRIKNCVVDRQSHFLYTGMLREAEKKVPPLMAGPLRGGGVKAWSLRKKRTFFETVFFYFVAI